MRISFESCFTETVILCICIDVSKGTEFSCINFLLEHHYVVEQFIWMTARKNDERDIPRQRFPLSLYAFLWNAANLK